jgi:23S rRNA (guanosine2251-2'-O)-methyltransferase
MGKEKDNNLDDKVNHEQHEQSQIIEGRNAVLEALRSKKPIDKLFVLDGCQDGPIRTIVREAKKGDSILNFVNKERLSQLSVTGKHQGVIAYIAAYEYATIDEMLELAKERGEDPFLILLDGIEDPHNLGAILRTCDAAGVDGVIIGKHRSVSLNATVAKVSTGAIETVKVAQVTNLTKTIQELKKQDFWICGTDCTQSIDYRQADYRMPLVLVIGSEGAGISRLVKENCDFLVHIPIVGNVQSLNASVATGIMLYQIHGQRFP